MPELTIFNEYQLPILNRYLSFVSTYSIFHNMILIDMSLGQSKFKINISSTGVKSVLPLKSLRFNFFKAPPPSPRLDTMKFGKLQSPMNPLTLIGSVISRSCRGKSFSTTSELLFVQQRLPFPPFAFPYRYTHINQLYAQNRVSRLLHPENENYQLPRSTRTHPSVRFGAPTSCISMWSALPWQIIT